MTVLDGDGARQDDGMSDWPAPGPGSWMRDADHTTSPSSRIQQELFPGAMAAGFREFTTRYGLPLSHLDVRYVNGWQFMRPRPANTPERAVKPPPDAVLRSLLRLDPRARRREQQARRAFDERFWARDVDRWEHIERARWTSRNLTLQDEAPDGLDDSALAEHLRRGRRQLRPGDHAALRPARADTCHR